MDTPEITADDFDEMLARFWPLLGPYHGDRSLSAADTVYELIRYLNHATRHADALAWPSTVAGILGSLSTATGAMPQLTEQLTTRYATLAAHPRAYVYGSHGRDGSRESVDATVAELREQLLTVAGLSAALGRALSTAQTLADRIGIAEAPADDTHALRTGMPRSGKTIRQPDTTGGNDQ